MSVNVAGLLAAGIRQYGTHRAITGLPDPHSNPQQQVKLDAIIVPGSRLAPNLDQAVTLARAARCWLLVVCSQHLRGAEVKEFFAARSFRNAIVIDLPPAYSHELLEFPALDSIADELPHQCRFYQTDLSMKRNLGLLLAKMLGWKHIFFLDDDIRDIAHPDLQATVDMLGSFPAVGMRVTDFPDNSIVCHANREAKGSQDVFVSGAALAVATNVELGFFPDIYNEDWLFFFDDASRGQLANSCREVTQLAYYPFANANRAAWQEFGDVLAEGLYALLHLHRNVQDATPAYWAKFLQARQKFLENILNNSRNADLEIQYEMETAVKAALGCLHEIKPEICAKYIRAWRDDLVLWKERLTAVSAGSPVSLEDALAKLELSSTAPAGKHWRVRPTWDEAKPAMSAGRVPIPQIDTIKDLGDTKPLEIDADEVLSAAARNPTSDGRQSLVSSERQVRRRATKDRRDRGDETRDPFAWMIMRVGGRQTRAARSLPESSEESPVPSLT